VFVVSVFVFVVVAVVVAEREVADLITNTSLDAPTLRI